MATETSLTAPYVFLSYASTDREQALHIADRLEAQKIAVWIDRKSIAGGSSWSAEIVRGIRGCAVFAVACSPSAMVSPNVQQEIQVAFESRRPILPLLVAPVDLPEAVVYALAGRQWIEVLDHPAEIWSQDALRALRSHGLGPSLSPPVVGSLPVPDGGRVAVSFQSNLPIPPTSLIGRQQELEAVRQRLFRSDVRLITLTGPGGVGKTRLALEVATEALAAFADGVIFVPLAATSDPTQVSLTIAQAIGADSRATASVRDVLVDKQVLLVLDNFEHVLPAAPFVADLLAACPRLKVMVTSRSALQLRGERSMPVPPLQLPDLDHLPSIDRLLESEAVRLFVDRATDVKPDFVLTEQNARAIAEICHRLDGLPLAIELAAARVRAFAPAVMVGRLASRLTLLTGALRDLPARQQTLRNAIAWSYNLLTEPEKRLFRHLATFSEGCTLEAAEAVLIDSPAVDLIDGLSSLVEKCLLREDDQPPVNGSSEPRYRMYETIREYAVEQLAADPEEEIVRRRHADFYLRLVDAARMQRSYETRVQARRLLEREHANLRAALQWAERTGDTDLGQLLSSAVAWLAQTLVEAFQGKAAVGDYERMLDRARQSGNRKVEHDALLGLAQAYFVLALDDEGSIAAVRMRDHVEEAIDLARTIGDNAALARSLILSVYLTDFWPDYVPRVAANLREALALSRDIGDEDLLLESKIAVYQHLNRDEAEPLAVEVEKQLRARQDWVNLNRLYFMTTWMDSVWGVFHRCVVRCDAAIGLAKVIGVPPVQYPTFKALALISLGRYDRAWESLGEEVADEAHPFGRTFRDFGTGVYLWGVMAFEQAAETFRHVVDQARSLHRPWLERAAQLWYARSLIGIGEHDDDTLERIAGPVARWGEPIPVDQLFDFLPPLPVTMLAELRFAQGRLAEALGHVDQAVAISLANGRVADEVLARELQLRIHNASGRSREAIALADELLPVAQSSDFKSMLWRIHADKAEALKQLGNGDDARSERKVGTELIHTAAQSIPDPKLRQGFLASKAVTAVVAGQARPEEQNE